MKGELSPKATEGLADNACTHLLPVACACRADG